MKLNQEKAIELAVKHLHKLKIKFLSEKEMKASFNENEELRDYSIHPTWVVSYEYMVFEEEIAFIYISDDTGKVFYIMDKHGYIENDGTR